MSNGQFQLLTIILSFLAVVFIPTMILLVRGAIKWTRVETKLSEVADDLKQIVIDKDKVHQEMLSQMREDRDATNLRLRWLEENQWKTHKP
jgi:hypothetical protein